MEPNRSIAGSFPAAAAEQGAEGALVPIRERSHPEDSSSARLRCEKPSDTLAWQLHDGRLIPLRCGASNRCRYCSWLTAVENATVVALDAADDMPRVGFTLTTRAAHTPPEKFRNDVRLAFRAIRRRWPDAEYLGQIEFTTGEGTRSGGARRIHQHGLLKGVPPDDLPSVEDVLRSVWKARTGAHRVEAHELHKPAGAIAYLVNHHQKTAQAPPKGWSGKRFRPSRGYFAAPVSQLRERAKATLADKRAEHAIRRLLDSAMAWDVLDALEAEELFDRLVGELRQAPAAELVRVAKIPKTWTDDGLPKDWATEVLGPVAAGA